jgi:mannose-6-phosphate isomerase-like protein (cupin superfamily)
MKDRDRRLILSLVAVSIFAVAIGNISTSRSQSEPSGESSVPMGSETVEEMLAAFVQDYRSDPVASAAITFGVRIHDAEPPDWHVVVAGRETEDDPARVTLNEGLPSEPVAFFVTDEATLSKIYNGELAALTAMGKAVSSDFAPMDIDVMEGFQPTPQAIDLLIRTSFHFWTRGFPEVVRFGDKRLTRELHGGNAVLFYYQKGFRSGWFQIEPGQHVNEDPSTQINEFPTILVVTKGEVDSKIGAVERRLVEGEMIYIGAGVAHEFWNSANEPGEGILLMFGEGA